MKYVLYMTVRGLQLVNFHQLRTGSRIEFGIQLCLSISATVSKWTMQTLIALLPKLITSNATSTLNLREYLALLKSQLTPKL